MIYGDAAVINGSGIDVASGGDDKIFGGESNTFNYLYGDAKSCSEGMCGDDLIVAGGENTVNSLYGDALGADSGSRACNDRLISGRGNDDMWGDFQYSFGDVFSGNDVFYLMRAMGKTKSMIFGAAKIK